MGICSGASKFLASLSYTYVFEGTNSSCRGYNWKLGADDCRYALRRLMKDCNTIDNKFRAGRYTYRCVRYSVYSTNDPN
jgi:hypothetical protein